MRLEQPPAMEGSTMSETETVETPQPDASAAETSTPDTSPEPLGEGGKRALEAERQARKDAERKASELAEQVAQYEAANKSEQERLADALAAAQAEAATAKAEALRLRVAAETDLPAELHEFLTGSDEDELRSKAEKLKAATATGARRPAPDPSQGAKPDSTGPSQLTRADLARMTPAEIEKARVDGRLADVLAGSG
jgi:membrane protein involved in colicin uptake